jgi:hypothetical protein
VIGAAALLLGVPLAWGLAPEAATGQAARADEFGGTDWGATAAAFRGRNGTRVTYTCPSYGTARTVWGTDVYTDDSSVCTAAVHAGLITLAGGGHVTIEIQPGQRFYAGSARNGVTSSQYGPWSGSFVVVDATPAQPGLGVGGTGWNLNAGPFRPYVGERFAYDCPAGGTAGTVWGTDLYTDDSSVCTAAVHAGVITVAAGGTVTIEMRPGASSYRGTTRNGITTREYGTWPGSYVLLGAPPGQPPAPGAPPVGTATGAVLVNGQPFTSGPVPYGATVDVTRGRLTMRADVGTLAVYGAGVPARFRAARVTERVGGKTRPFVELRLVGGSFASCAKRALAGREQAPPGKKKVVRALWGSGKGGFRTRGANASAAVRGTIWRTVDRCDGTLVVVRQGVVSVRDLTRKRTVSVRAGKSYLAPARRR